MALVDTRFNSYRPSVDVIANNSTIKIGSITPFIFVRSTVSPGKVRVPITPEKITGVNFRTSVNTGSTTIVTVFVNSVTPAQASNVVHKIFSSSVQKSVVVSEDTLKNVPVSATNQISVARVAISTNAQFGAIAGTLKTVPVNSTQIIVARSPVATNRRVMTVRTVVVQEENKVFGFRIPPVSTYVNNITKVSTSVGVNTTLSTSGFRIPYVNDTKRVIVSKGRLFFGDRKPSVIVERYVFVRDSKNSSKPVTQIVFDQIRTKTVEIQNRTETKRSRMYDLGHNTRKSTSINVKRGIFFTESKIISSNIIDNSIPGAAVGGGAGGGAAVLTEFWS